MSSLPVSLDRAVIVVLATFGSDAQTLAQIIGKAGAQARICASANDLCACFNDSTAAILVTEESLLEPTNAINSCLSAQPPWSDVPVIILSGGRGKASTQARWSYFRQFRNVTVIDRPLHSNTIMLAIEAACRAREWQYVVRDQMLQLEQQNAALEQRVRERTQALQRETDERKRIESALNEARRLEAIGRLAGGVAHDFNNLLQVISSACSLLTFVSKDAQRFRSVQDTILRATERGSRLTQQLLAFGRRQTLASDVLDITQQLMGLKELLQQSLREKIVLEVRLQADLWPAHADVTQLEVALLNLTINAKHALPDGGTVTLSARNVHLPTDDIPEVSDLQGDFVWLSLSDTGRGMPAEVAAQAFEPFFTTRSVGEGSGLGLSQVYGFAKQSGGTAWIRSSEQGTSVSILLPRAVTGQRGNREETLLSADVEGARDLHGLRILYVEDDEAVGDMTLSLLDLLECKATWVRDADQALQANLHDFDLMFSDVRMPGSMDGIALAKEVKKRRPEMKVLLASGYVISPERMQALPVNFIAKPYVATTLETALLHALQA